MSDALPVQPEGEFSPPNLDGLLCALVLAPGTFSRNRFYPLFKDPGAKRVRRRAARLSGIVRHLAGRAEPKAVVEEARFLDENRLLLRYRVPTVGLSRTAILEPLEEAAVRYALDRAGARAAGALPLSGEHRALVEEALRTLGEGLSLPGESD